MSRHNQKRNRRDMVKAEAMAGNGHKAREARVMKAVVGKTRVRDAMRWPWLPWSLRCWLFNGNLPSWRSWRTWRTWRTWTWWNRWRFPRATVSRPCSRTGRRHRKGPKDSLDMPRRIRLSILASSWTGCSRNTSSRGLAPQRRHSRRGKSGSRDRRIGIYCYLQRRLVPFIETNQSRELGAVSWKL